MVVHANPLAQNLHMASVDSMGPSSDENNPSNPGMSSRQRLRWTNELHDRFVDAVAQLGGPDSNNAEQGDQGDILSNIDNSTGLQITEALKLQMEVQKRLHEQLEVQRQLQLRIEAQGKYLKKIIEEQQRINGVLVESPGVGSISPISADTCPVLDKTDPSTPAPMSESHLQDRPMHDDYGPFKGHSHNESVSPHHEPLTPDSSCRNGSPFESPKSKHTNKRQRYEGEQGGAGQDLMLTHHILESSSGPCFQHPGLMFPMAGTQFDLHAVGNGYRVGDR